MGAIAAVVLGALLIYFLWPRSYVSTDDAFIAADVVEVSPRVNGRVWKVNVQDNQLVNKWDVLFELDRRDFIARSRQAEAAVAVARASLQSARATAALTAATTPAAIASAEAQLRAAQARTEQARAAVGAATAELERANADLARIQAATPGALSAQQRDVIVAAQRSAQAREEAEQRAVAQGIAEQAAAESALASARAGTNQVAVAQAEVQRAESELSQAQAALVASYQAELYTFVPCLTAGRVARKNVETGDYIREGQTALAIVPADVYVVANFKETQLQHVRIGAPATIHIDAYPDADFQGHVDSIQPGSGAAFSLLPPENATGNYVKVVQRVPVKIVFDEPPDPARFNLGPGMSVVPRVRVR